MIQLHGRGPTGKRGTRTYAGLYAIKASKKNVGKFLPSRNQVVSEPSLTWLPPVQIFYDQ